ncbi:MAG TPA: TlyA family RNA methyltransferase [Candidatus Saccharimonadales bacterium]|nr:TlyA family RNA methyltransferase [Candidatus Saccharimonadales bacterium]
MKQRLDVAMVACGLVGTRSQAESFIKLGDVKVNGQVVTKAGQAVAEHDTIELTASEQYVSRAGLKLASVAKVLKLDFKDKTVLDVGSSTGGFTDYALQHGAKKVIAVEVGTNQLHPSLHGHPQIELHEKTDIRDVRLRRNESPVASRPSSAAGLVYIDTAPDIVVADVSFISLREILPSVAKLANKNTQLAMMVKPQFEAAASNLKHKGVIKNDKMRRDILKGFEDWTRQLFVIVDKADSDVAGAKGNRERFYLLKKL